MILKNHFETAPLFESEMKGSFDTMLVNKKRRPLEWA